MPAVEPKSRKTSLLLMGSEVTSFDEARNPSLEASDYDSYAVSLDGAQGELHVRKQFSRRPRWIEALHEDGVIELEDLANFRTSSSSAVLFLEEKGRRFAATFGSGRFMLNPDAIEDDFGLLVVLSSVDANRLVSVDSTTFEEKTLHARRQVSSEGPMSTFGLDVERDIVKGVAGRPPEASGLGTYIAGSDSLQITAKKSLRNIPELCELALVAYESGDVPDAFQWVNNIKRVRENAVIEKLDDEALELLNARDWNNIHLAPPDVLRPDVGKYFEFSFSDDDEMDDPSITRFFESVPRRGDLKLIHLKQHKLRAITEDENLEEGVWPVYKCIVAELEQNGERYSLSGGHWYKINQDFREEVVKSVEAIKDSAIEFPECKSAESEGDFNVRAAEELGANLLDTRTVQIAGYDRFEICDIAAREGDTTAFVHVKKRGASSTLSHLFFQGVNSAQLLRTNQQCLERARAIVVDHPEDWHASVPEGGIDPAKSEVCFAVITRGRENGLPMTLPFFSLVSMRNAARTLTEMGFTVSKARVRQAEANDPG